MMINMTASDASLLAALALATAPPGKIDITPIQALDQPDACSIDLAADTAKPAIYPAAALKAGVSGTSIVSISANAEGKVIDVRVEKSSRNRDLDRAAMETARRWKLVCPDDTPSATRTAKAAFAFSSPYCRLGTESRAAHPAVWPTAATSEGGTTILNMRAFDTAGNSEVELLESSGDPLLDDAAVQAAQKWRFECPQDMPEGSPWIKESVYFTNPDIPRQALVSRHGEPDEPLKRDDKPLEFSHVEKFLPFLASNPGISRSELVLPPGMLMYQSTPGAYVASKDLEAETWIVYTSPHPMAPSVVRLRTFNAGDYPFGPRARKIAFICEGSAPACKRMRATVDAAVKAGDAPPGTFTFIP